jgi:hypothetical protein
VTQHHGMSRMAAFCDIFSSTQPKISLESMGQFRQWNFLPNLHIFRGNLHMKILPLCPFFCHVLLISHSCVCLHLQFATIQAWQGLSLATFEIFWSKLVPNLHEIPPPQIFTGDWWQGNWLSGWKSITKIYHATYAVVSGMSGKNWRSLGLGRDFPW